jgi:hypothetical protein
MIVGGLVLIVVPLFAHLDSGAGPTQSLIRSFAPVMTANSVGVVNSDLQHLHQGDVQLTTAVLPSLAVELHMTPAQLQGFLSTHFAATSAGITALPAILTHFEALGAILQQQRPDFTAAKAVPFLGLPLTSLPLIYLGLGILGIASGLWCLFRPAGRPWLPATILGIVVLVAVLAGSLVPKAVSVDHLVTALKPVMTQATVSSATNSLHVVGAMGSHLQGDVLPAVAAELHTTPQVLSSNLATHFPAFGWTLASLPSVSTTFSGLTSTINVNLNNYSHTESVRSLTFLVWLLVGVAVLWILLGLVVLGDLKSRPRNPVVTT